MPFQISLTFDLPRLTRLLPNSPLYTLLVTFFNLGLDMGGVNT